MTRAAVRFINNVLATIIIVLACFIIFSPFLPELQLDIQKLMHSPEDELKQIITIGEQNGALDPESPPDNTIVIPEIGINGEVIEGLGVETMNQGIWHRPKSSTPDKGGNTVLVAHRYMYTSGPNTFYHLPKLKKGNKIVLYWQKKKYVYVVDTTEIVDPDAIEIEEQTSSPILTLYTCTPLWTAEKRFVVKAKPI